MKINLFSVQEVWLNINVQIAINFIEYNYLEKDREFNVFRVEYVLDDDDMGEKIKIKIKIKIRVIDSDGQQYEYYENDYIIGFEHR